MAVTIAGRQFWLLRAVDDEGEVPDLPVEGDARTTAAVKPTRKLLKKHAFARRAGFNSPGSAQRFLSFHAAVQNAVNVQRHLVSRNTLRTLRGEAFQNWRAATAA
jgi:putative transposase